jgi:hypothetical protein
MGLGLQPVRTTNSETQVPISAITVISCPGWAVYLLLVNGGMLSWFLVKSLLWWICVKAFSFYIFCTIDMQESQSLFPCSSLTRLGSKQFMSHVIPFWMLNCFVTVIWGGMNNKHMSGIAVPLPARHALLTSFESFPHVTMHELVTSLKSQSQSWIVDIHLLTSQQSKISYNTNGWHVSIKTACWSELHV